MEFEPITNDHICKCVTSIPSGRVPYSRKIWQFGGLYYNRQIKICQNFLLAYIHMAIPYRTSKFKSANILAIVILGSTAKFNSRQYFQLYGIYLFLFSSTPESEARFFLCFLDLAQLAPGYFHALINHHNGGKPKGEKKLRTCTCTYNYDCTVEGILFSRITG